ncbi:Biotin synthase [Dirofilaria immitis]
MSTPECEYLCRRIVAKQNSPATYLIAAVSIFGGPYCQLSILPETTHDVFHEFAGEQSLDHAYAGTLS